MNIFNPIDWEATKVELLEKLGTPAIETVVAAALERQRESMMVDMETFAPQRAFNTARKNRIQQIRIKRNLVNNRRKQLGLKPYRPKISVFAKKQKDCRDMPMIRRIIPGTIAFDLPSFPAINSSEIFTMQYRYNARQTIELAK